MPPELQACFVKLFNDDVVLAEFAKAGESKSVQNMRGLQHSGRHGGLADLGGNIKEGSDSLRGHNDEGSPARFFANLADNTCHLCHTLRKTSNKELCKNTPVKSAARNGKTIRATTQSTVQENVPGKLDEQLVHNVKSAGDLCDLCATHIAHALVKIKNSDFNKQEFLHTLAYIGDWKSSILIQNLVNFADLWDNTDTTPTIQSLSLLFGFAPLATEKYTKQESLKNDNDSVQETHFLYTSKASSSERNMLYGEFEEQTVGDGPPVAIDNAFQRGKTLRTNTHPTVKPIILMQYLIKLITPPKGIVLDPFAGSGSTLLAAKDSGFNWIGIEIDPDYVKIAEARMKQGTLDL